MKQITRNRARCRKCNDIIESEYRHDFRSCECGAISVDGGKAYLRRLWGGGLKPERKSDSIEELSEYTEIAE
jgi:hypothetical protein